MTRESGGAGPRGGRPLARAYRPGAAPAILFLPGYASDMTGGKATALDAWAAGHGRAMLRFDYAGCGASGGTFDEQTLDGWRDDAVAMIDALDGAPVVLVGSSMGGWLMLLAALARPERVAGLVGIAAAPDFTEWGFGEDKRALLARDGRIEEPSGYDDTVTVTTRAFRESGQRLRVLEGEIPIDAPVRLIQGARDPDVPVAVALRLAERLRSDDVQTILVKDGDHRLSRPQDIALLLTTVSALVERP